MASVPAEFTVMLDGAVPSIIIPILLGAPPAVESKFVPVN